MSVLVEQHGAVLVVILNRPDQRHALDGPTMSGVGRTFCAGIDLKSPR